ncbi:MAG: AAA family ATPase, partial [bacterium]
MSTTATQTNEEVTISGRVVHLFYQAPHFTAGVMKSTREGKVKFSGKFMVSEGDDVSLIGKWEQHPQYGRQFTAVGVKQDLPLDTDGLAHYLANDPAFHGIGPERARKIAEEFGDQFDTVIREEPWRVAQVAQLKPEILNTLQHAWVQRSEVNALSAWLSSYGLTHRQMTRLVEGLGQNTKAILQENPYEICRQLPGLGFGRVDEMAQKMGVVKEHPARIAAVFQHILMKFEQDGHCWVEENVLLHESFKVLCLDGLNAHTIIREQLDIDITSGRLFRYDGGGRWVIALPLLAKREMEIIRTLLHERAELANEAMDWEALLSEVAPELNASQRTAALTACRHRLSLIAGAAGSGKSFTVAAIYRMFSELWDDVALAAPTGKAAKRLEQLCGTEAKTIHRLLEYNTVSWGRDRENPLEVDAVIIDEVSMCDIHLMWHLLEAIDFTRTRVILVGDPNQLPPVGPGNVLRDLLARKVISTTVLDQVVRQAGALKENCTAILRGELRETAAADGGQLRPWYLIDDCR